LVSNNAATSSSSNPANADAACRQQHGTAYKNKEWPGGEMDRTLNSQLKIHRIESQPFHFQVTTTGKLIANVPLSSRSIIWYQSNGSDALQLGR